MIRALLASLLAATALAVVPAAAIAQDAGGNQYTDPLGSGSGHNGGSNGTSGSGSSSSGSSTPTASAGTASGTSTNSATTAPRSARGRSSGLPRTGFPVAWLIAAGVLSLGGGVALRRVAVGTRR